jgi:hypothetical protein
VQSVPQYSFFQTSFFHNGLRLCGISSRKD